MENQDVEDTLIAEIPCSIDTEIETLKSIFVHELDVIHTDSFPRILTVNLEPSTADVKEASYVCLSLQITIPEGYPEDLPAVILKNPRGLSEEGLNRIITDVKDKSEMLKGNPMLFELIDTAKEYLTFWNMPSCQCAICLYDFSQEDVFTKTECYHYFHSHCLTKYVKYSKEKFLEEQNQKDKIEDPKEFQPECPVCRVVIHFNSDENYPAPLASSLDTPFEISSDMKEVQEKLASLYENQKAKGGIIDLEEEKNKFLIEISSVPTTTSAPKIDTPNEKSDESPTAKSPRRVNLKNSEYVKKQVLLKKLEMENEPSQDISLTIESGAKSDKEDDNPSKSDKDDNAAIEREEKGEAHADENSTGIKENRKPRGNYSNDYNNRRPPFKYTSNYNDRRPRGNYNRFNQNRSDWYGNKRYDDQRGYSDNRYQNRRNNDYYDNRRYNNSYDNRRYNDSYGNRRYSDKRDDHDAGVNDKDGVNSQNQQEGANSELQTSDQRDGQEERGKESSGDARRYTSRYPPRNKQSPKYKSESNGDKTQQRTGDDVEPASLDDKISDENLDNGEIRKKKTTYKKKTPNRKSKTSTSISETHETEIHGGDDLTGTEASANGFEKEAAILKDENVETSGRVNKNDMKPRASPNRRNRFGPRSGSESLDPASANDNLGREDSTEKSGDKKYKKQYRKNASNPRQRGNLAKSLSKDYEDYVSQPEGNDYCDKLNGSRPNENSPEKDMNGSRDNDNSPEKDDGSLATGSDERKFDEKHTPRRDGYNRYPRNNSYSYNNRGRGQSYKQDTRSSNNYYNKPNRYSQDRDSYSRNYAPKHYNVPNNYYGPRNHKNSDSRDAPSNEASQNYTSRRDSKPNHTNNSQGKNVTSPEVRHPGAEFHPPGIPVNKPFENSQSGNGSINYDVYM